MYFFEFFVSFVFFVFFVFFIFFCIFVFYFYMLFILFSLCVCLIWQVLMGILCCRFCNQVYRCPPRPGGVPRKWAVHRTHTFHHAHIRGHRKTPTQGKILVGLRFRVWWGWGCSGGVPWEWAVHRTHTLHHAHIRGPRKTPTQGKIYSQPSCIIHHKVIPSDAEATFIKGTRTEKSLKVV